MNVKHWILAAAVAAVAVSGAGMGGVVRAQSALDEGLGDTGGKTAQVEGAKEKSAATAAPAAGPAVKADPKAEVKPMRPKMPDLVSPDAAKTVDDQDLLDKLTGKSDVNGGDGGGPAKKIEEIMDRMGQASQRLKEQQDPGNVTQETQRRIVTDLDVMIEYLKQQQKGGGQSPSTGKPGEKQDRTMSQGQQSGQGMGGTEGRKDANPNVGTPETPVANNTDIHQTGTNWGGLPPGDRELVAHGANEHYLPEYREMINKYYQALAEIGRSKSQ